MQETNKNKEEQETNGKTKGLENTAKALQNTSAAKAAAAAGKQAAEIPQEVKQAAEQTLSQIPNDFSDYIDAIINAKSFAEMKSNEKTAYLQAVQTLNTQLKDNISKLQQLINLDIYDKAHLSNQLLNGTLLQIYEALEEILAFYQSDTWEHFSVLFPDMPEYFAGTTIQQESYLDTFFLLDFCRKLKAAKPFAAVEIKAYKKRSGKESITFREFQENILPKCLEKAGKAAGETGEKENEFALSARAISPKSYIIPNDIISNNMHKGLVNAGAAQLNPSRNHKYLVYTDIFLDSEKYTVTGGAFTKHDKRVLNGICSLWEAGNTVFTSDMVYRAMNGLQESEYVSPQARGTVTKSIEKLANITISIDATEEFEARNIKGYESTFFGNCIYIKGMRVSKKKSKDPAYTIYNILEKPILYQYAQRLNQVITVPLKELAIKDVLANGKISETGPRNGEKFVAIKEFLLLRIEKMKSDKKRKNNYDPTIKIDTFYRETETRTDNTRYTTRAKEQAAQCLAYWKADGYIKDFEFVGKRPVKSIKIYLQ